VIRFRKLWNVAYSITIGRNDHLRRKEVVLSSMIEGTHSSLSDLPMFELDQEHGAPLNDVREVSNYVAALDHGLRRLAEGFPPGAALMLTFPTGAKYMANSFSPSRFRSSSSSSWS
jgi:Fic family protein